MKIVIGLGNPGREYAHTRHNVGYDTIDILADKHGINIDSEKFKGLIGKGIIGGEKVILVKPLTYMNLSGECLRQVVDYFKVDYKTDVIVVYDDIALTPGLIRVRKRGSAGGHNGIKNIIAHLGSEDFLRVRVGVGEKPKGYDLADYVLGHFKEEEKEEMQTGLINAVKAIEMILAGDVDAAMNEFNKKKDKAE